MNPSPERVFDVEDLGPSLGVMPRGLLMEETSHPASASGQVGRLRVVRSGGQQVVVHVRLPHGSLAAAGIAAVRSGRAAGVAMHEGGSADPARLALAFAAHLEACRRYDPHPVRPCVTSAGEPDITSAPDLLRLPHLVTLSDHARGLSDTVVWEVMTRWQAGQWLGCPIPDQALFERQLPALLHLRSLVRAGMLPPGELSQRLRDLLAGRYMSIRLVYRHPALFTSLLRAIDPPAASGEDVG